MWRVGSAPAPGGPHAARTMALGIHPRQGWGGAGEGQSPLVQASSLQMGRGPFWQWQPACWPSAPGAEASRMGADTVLVGVGGWVEGPRVPSLLLALLAHLSHPHVSAGPLLAVQPVEV